MNRLSAVVLVINPLNQALARSLPNGSSNNALFPLPQNSTPTDVPSQSSSHPTSITTPHQRSNHQHHGLGSDLVDSPITTQTPDIALLTDMAPIDRWGLQGLLYVMNHPSRDQAALAAGQDLTTLGLDLNQPE